MHSDPCIGGLRITFTVGKFTPNVTHPNLDYCWLIVERAQVFVTNEDTNVYNDMGMT